MTNEAIEAAALLPCPFCGGEAFSGLSENEIAFAGCADHDCIAFSAAFDFVSVEAAIAAWNTRAAAPVLMEEGARLALEAAISLWSRHKYSGDYSDAIAALDPAAIVKGAGRE